MFCDNVFVAKDAMIAERFWPSKRPHDSRSLLLSLSCAAAGQLACEHKSCLPFSSGMKGKGLCRCAVKGEQLSRMDGGNK